jgi:hypothetical protein
MDKLMEEYADKLGLYILLKAISRVDRLEQEDKKTLIKSVYEGGTGKSVEDLKK